MSRLRSLVKLQEAAEQSEARLGERLAKAQLALDRARRQVERIRDQIGDAKLRHESRVAAAQASIEEESRRAKSAGVVTVLVPNGIEDRQLDRSAAEVVKRLIGRKRVGIFSPLDGQEAQELLTAIDRVCGNVGDSFDLQLTGRKGAIHFDVVSDGLKFWIGNTKNGLPFAA